MGDSFSLSHAGKLDGPNPDRSASLDELTAVSAARDCADELPNARVAELRSDPQRGQTWPAMASALGCSSTSATQQRNGSRTVDVTTDGDQQVSAFWRVCSGRFTWIFFQRAFSTRCTPGGALLEPDHSLRRRSRGG